MSGPCTIRMGRSTYDRLKDHLFRDDNDEHGAVLTASMVATDRGTRLLVRDVIFARDGIEYVQGQRGYRMLRAEFVRDQAERCRAEGLCYIAVHNHRGGDHVAFSPDDMSSHERGYPALLQIVRNAVGALVFARNAVAGDIWLPTGERVTIDEMVIIGRSITHLYPMPPNISVSLDGRRLRQSLLLGPRGQDILRQLKIGIIGAGGVGSLLVEYLARLGVGTVLVIDPDHIDESNFSRQVGSREQDFCPLLTRSRVPQLRRIGVRLSKAKVDIARRSFRIANREGHILAMRRDVRDDPVAMELLDCDYLFLAADPMQVRLVFNAIVHQFLIPGVQVGAKGVIDSQTGQITDVFSVVRHVTPDRGCLWCNGLISPTKLVEESASASEARAQRYIDDPLVVAPSVITLNAAAAGRAVDDFLFAVTDLRSELIGHEYVKFEPRSGDIKKYVARKSSTCNECGLTKDSRLAMGLNKRLPTRSLPRIT